MVPLISLWLPIVLSAVVVFVASSILHMVLPYHHSDYTKLPDEEKILPVLRAANLAPGLYNFPFCTHKDMKSPESIERYKKGPVGLITVIPSGPPNMGKYLGLWFTYCVIMSFFVAYLAAHALPIGTHYLLVFRIVGTAAFIGYGLSCLSNGIWKGQPLSNVMKEVVDGLIYGLLTAGVFGWLWPR
jgi:hypothetical protein